MHALYIEKSGVKWQEDEPGDLASGIVVSNQKSLLQKWPLVSLKWRDTNSLSLLTLRLKMD